MSFLCRPIMKRSKLSKENVQFEEKRSSRKWNVAKYSIQGDKKFKIKQNKTD